MCDFLTIPPEMKLPADLEYRIYEATKQSVLGGSPKEEAIDEVTQVIASFAAARRGESYSTSFLDGVSQNASMIARHYFGEMAGHIAGQQRGGRVLERINRSRLFAILGGEFLFATGIPAIKISPVITIMSWLAGLTLIVYAGTADIFSQRSGRLFPGNKVRYEFVREMVETYITGIMPVRYTMQS